VTAHDPRLAAALARAVLPGLAQSGAAQSGGAPAAVAPANAGLARLLASLQPQDAGAPPAAQAAAPASEAPGLDVTVLLEEARAAGEAAGYAAGEAAGREAAAAELAPLRQALEAAAAACRAATTIDEAPLRPLLVDLVGAVARTVLMAELAAGGRVLAPLAAAALAEVAEAALPRLIAHPDTLALLARDLPPGLLTAADATLPAGHVSIAGPDYRIEAGLDERLGRLLANLP
jgi:flagellar assembly protein FliH